jgi:CHASE1-domain containing sensor protein
MPHARLNPLARKAPLLPAMVILLLGLGATMLAWRREGR